jgi:hypothetical protein
LCIFWQLQICSRECWICECGPIKKLMAIFQAVLLAKLGIMARNRCSGLRRYTFITCTCVVMFNIMLFWLCFSDDILVWFLFWGFSMPDPTLWSDYCFHVLDIYFRIMYGRPSDKIDHIIWEVSIYSFALYVFCTMSRWEWKGLLQFGM